MNHPVEATVLRVEFVTPSGTSAALNYPVYPWTDLKQFKTNLRIAAKQEGARITRLYKTQKLIENPLLK